LQLWDTAGQERFRSLIPSYIRDSHVAVVVFDITSRESFESTTKWIADVRAQRGNDVVIVLVGNKTDLSASRQVTTAELEARANEHEIMFIETSAKEGFNIKLLFRRLATVSPASTHLRRGARDSPSPPRLTPDSARLLVDARGPIRLAQALPSLEKNGDGSVEQPQVVHLTMAPPKPAADEAAGSSCGC